MVKVLRYLMVLGRVRATKTIKGKSESFSKLLLDSVHLGAVFRHRKASLVRGKFCRGAMLVGCANKQYLVSAGTIKTSTSIRRKHRANQVAKMFNPIDVGEGGSNEITIHYSGAALV